MKNETMPGITMENYHNLIRYILSQTNMAIALIPHVVWKDNDDRIPLHMLYDAYKNSGRIVMIEDHTCEELKGYIARCSFFVGARTHTTIAAYSSCIPTLVVGYSVKARGIARDLFGTEDGYVLPVQEMCKPQQLTESFKTLYENCGRICAHLSEKMRDYCNNASAIRAIVEL